MNSPKKHVLKWVVEDSADNENKTPKKKTDAHTVSIPGLGVCMADGGSPVDEEGLDSSLDFDDYCDLKFPDIKRG